MIVAIVHDIFEGDDEIPTLRHVFYGPTKKRAEEVFAAHMKTDAFLHDCVRRGHFKGIDCLRQRTFRVHLGSASDPIPSPAHPPRRIRRP